MIAHQRPDATTVAGFKAWLGLGYCVRKGETAIYIWAKRALSQRMRGGVVAASVHRDDIGTAGLFEPSTVSCGVCELLRS